MSLIKKPLADLEADIKAVSRIAAIPTILDVVTRATGLGFAAVARVTEERWIACEVLDLVGFGLQSGGELEIQTTICHEIWSHRQPVVIEHVAEDPVWSCHRTPARYCFQSYISVPIILADRSMFGTLCALDAQPKRLNNPETIGMFRLFADLIGKHLDSARKLAETEQALARERELAELREQFMAVLGHDLRSPLRGVLAFSQLLLKQPLQSKALEFATLIQNSAVRMQQLTDNLLDLARSRLGSGLPIAPAVQPVRSVLDSVLSELSASYPGRMIQANWDLEQAVCFDATRLAQLFSNLLSNALLYGANDRPVQVEARSTVLEFRLSVTNYGAPIPASALSQLFQPFHRSGNSADRDGLGLGLYIAHQIALSHGGTLEVESSAERTRFSFLLPSGAFRGKDESLS